MGSIFQYILLGIAMVAWGISIIIDPVYYTSKFRYTWDFTEIKWYFGGFLVLFGGYFVVSSFFKKK